MVLKEHPLFLLVFLPSHEVRRVMSTEGLGLLRQHRSLRVRQVMRQCLEGEFLPMVPIEVVFHHDLGFVLRELVAGRMEMREKHRLALLHHLFVLGRI